MAEVTDEQIIEAVKDSNGILAAAARRLGCSRRTIYNHAEQSEEIRAVLEDERNVLLDDAEKKLYEKAITDGDTTSLIFLLKTIGKKRGYVERQELTGKDGEALQPIRVEIINTPNGS